MSTPSNEDRAGSMEVIDRQECLRLVGSLSVGRLAVSLTGEPPLVVPINFVVDGEVIVFRSDPGTKLQALRAPGSDRIARHPNASFQADLIDPVHRTGWSVLIRGVAYAAEADEVAHLDLASWAPRPQRPPASTGADVDHRSPNPNTTASVGHPRLLVDEAPMNRPRLRMLAVTATIVVSTWVATVVGRRARWTTFEHRL